MSAEAHHAAVVARLKAHPSLAASVFEVGAVPTTNPPKRYVVVSSTLGNREGYRFTGPRTQVTTTHYLYCVGESAAQARQVSGWVDAQLVDYTLTIANRNVRRPAEWVTRPIEVDKDGPFPLPFGVIRFDLISEPA